MRYKVLLFGLFLFELCGVSAQDFPLKINDKDHLEYPTDKYGNRILDFSYCGYKNSEKQIPNVPVKIYVNWTKGEQSERIQRAIDYVSGLKPDNNGIRGAVLIGKGVFKLNNPLRISKSGVVIRGVNPEETILLKQGFERGAAVYIEGHKDLDILDSMNLSSPYVPVNARTLDVDDASLLKKGDKVMIIRNSTDKWIKSLNCDIFGGGISALGWKEGDVDITWNRIVKSIDGNRITIDVPLSMALNKEDSDVLILKYSCNGIVVNSGIENLSIESSFDVNNKKDEDHCWNGVYLNNASDCWVRKTFFKHLAGSAVLAQRFTQRITVEDCISKEPISEIGGMRRQTFLTYGQQTLFQRCYSENGINDFAVGYAASGPNAFVQCDTKESLGFSGSLGAWATGLLYDVVNIDGNNLVFKNLGQDLNGAGWNSANSLFWQCTASEIECYTPQYDAPNRAYGCWAQFSGNGQWKESNNHVHPRSFFYTQLSQRLNIDSVEWAYILPLNTSATSSPTIDEALYWAEVAKNPRLTMEKWIYQIPFTASVSFNDVINVDKLKRQKIFQKDKSRLYEVKDGLLLADGKLLTGNRQEVQWWNGKIKPNYLAKMKPHITRFVPGFEENGGTDRIDSVISYMKHNNILILDHNYGLWYDRRRDDHERVRRSDGEVWAPFYEQPFSRSGVGTAWDGLSKYDLTKPNKWYWNRLHEFAMKAEKEGLLLFHQNYFQHNIIEAGAHWVDSPWRTVNNVNGTDFPEPVPFAGDKRIFMAEFFYDVTHPVRRELHRNYIRYCLEAMSDCPNVIHFISAEYTGPLHFVQFWLDVIAEWEQETGKHPLIALSTTKDVQDSILADDKRSKVVDIIDIRYWHYKTDGIFNPVGGVNMAPRQHMRKMKVGKASFKEVYKAVSEYRRKYSDKAVIYNAQNYSSMPWAVFMAGGSCPVLPMLSEDFLKDAAGMKVGKYKEGKYCSLVKNDTGIIIYSMSKQNITVKLSNGKYILKEINPKDGAVVKTSKFLVNNGIFELDVQSGGDIVYWVYKQ